MTRVFILISMLLVVCISCSKDVSLEEQSIDPIAGKWYLKLINDTDVSTINCYKDSFIESDGERITFFIQDRQEDDSCVTLFQGTDNLSIYEGFYYVGDEALEIYINGNRLTWRVAIDTTLEFEK